MNERKTSQRVNVTDAINCSKKIGKNPYFFLKTTSIMFYYTYFSIFISDFRNLLCSQVQDVMPLSVSGVNTIFLFVRQCHNLWIYSQTVIYLVFVCYEILVLNQYLRSGRIWFVYVMSWHRSCPRSQPHVKRRSQGSSLIMCLCR